MEPKYYPTIGLEIHAELATKTKMFCDSKNDPNEKEPNVNICPICLGHPGTLPVINKEAVKHVIKVGIAVGGEIADFTEFDRKNYFYPDIPKSYQISQYKYPLVKGGTLDGVKLTRIHLEEDTATSKHDQGDFSLIDFNRAGVPLMELVTEPVIHSAEEASSFAKELQLLLQYLGVAEANMEKGEMRVEANISISPISKSDFDIGKKYRSQTSILGTKVEVKNLNSFKSVEKAIAYEINRMAEILEKGEKVIQETRGWDEIKQKTFSQREKEESHDYRYFPDPDLPKLYISEVPEFKKEVLEKEIPELPSQKRERYKKDFGLKNEDVEMYVRGKEWGKFFEEVVSKLAEVRPLQEQEKSRGLTSASLVVLASNYVTSDLVGISKNSAERGLPAAPARQASEIFGKISAENFAELIRMIGARAISSRAAKDILAIMHKEGGDPQKIAASKNLLQKQDAAELKIIVQNIIASSPQVVADYKGGKETALQFFVGQAMKETKGAANPEKLREILLELLQ